MTKEPLCPSCWSYGIFLGETGIRHSCMALHNTMEGSRSECEDYVERRSVEFVHKLRKNKTTYKKLTCSYQT